jgi:N-acetylneuraminate synthase
MVKFISEISSNHSKDLSRAFDFIDTSAEINCDVVKFQLFKIDQLFSQEILRKSEKHRKRKEWELPVDFLPMLAERCQKKNILFSCTPFYLEAVDELFPYVSFYKIASYELLWEELLIKCAKTGKPVTLSTGMATIPEITRAVKILREHGCEPDLLHCTSAYPTPFHEANLGAIETIRKATNVREVGWSDHTVSPGVIHRAIHKWGASTVEFHLDLDGKGEEFSAGHCWLPQQIGEVIKEVRKGLGADGSGIKEPVASELPDRMWRADPSDGLRPLKEIRNSFES